MKLPVMLVVNNDPQFAAAAAEVGRDCGYAVRIVPGSRAFARVYAEAMPDLVVAEYFMSGLDGMEIVNWLISAGHTGPVVITARPLKYGSGRFAGESLARAAVAVARHAGLFEVSVLPRPADEDSIRAAISAARADIGG